VKKSRIYPTLFSVSNFQKEYSLQKTSIFFFNRYLRYSLSVSDITKMSTADVCTSCVENGSVPVLIIETIYKVEKLKMPYKWYRMLNYRQCCRS